MVDTSTATSTALSTSVASEIGDIPTTHGFIDRAHKIKCGGTVLRDELIVDEIV